MSRLVPTPQELIDQLLRLLPHPIPARPKPGPDTEERILDAALAAFTAQGIRATTMSQIARDAGISREWLYKHFRNRDAIAVAITRREAVRLIEGIVLRASNTDELPEALAEAFVYGVEFLHDNALLQRVLSTETDALSPHLLHDAAPVVGIAVQTGAGYLSALYGLDPDRATLVAETLVRLVASIVLAPQGTLDLHDRSQLRRYAAAVVPAVLTIGASPAAAAHPKRSPTKHEPGRASS